jgi:gamma-glutamylcyclotransferase (GGCT)/AIG2-like uncharacterized protein YtfP
MKQDLLSLKQFLQRVKPMLKQKNTPKKKIEPIFYYFAYGHNTNTETLTELCPDSEFVGIGTLKNFQLTFEKYANIQTKAGKSLQGVVWRIKEKYLSKLDGYEGLHKNYNRIPVEVNLRGKKIECTAYIIDPEFEIKAIHVEPTEAYIKVCATGYSEHGIPLSQIEAALKRV